MPLWCSIFVHCNVIGEALCFIAPVIEKFPRPSGEFRILRGISRNYEKDIRKETTFLELFLATTKLKMSVLLAVVVILEGV